MQNEQAMNIIRYGRTGPLPERRKLTAGRLSAILEEGSLRYIKYGDRELVRGIYAAVRDRNWGTVAPVFNRFEVRQDADSFQVDFEAEHVNDDVRFVWTGRISGTAEGTIRFDMNGAARRSFLRNRIGFCVLHPVEQAGLQVEVVTKEKTVFGQFPEMIAPHQPFIDMKALRFSMEPGLEVSLQFFGDLFEMEDQRNWMDASFKTYCTPLYLPYPVRIEAGTEVNQSVVITVKALDGLSFVEEKTVIQPDDRVSGPLAELGTAAAGGSWSDDLLQAVRALPLSYLRRVIRFPEQAASWQRDIETACENAARANAALELELVLPEGDPALENIIAFIARSRLIVQRIFVFASDLFVTTQKQLAELEELRGKYGLDFEIGGGTCANFTELNRSDLPLEKFDCVGFTMNPQVHAFDIASIVETLTAIPAMVHTARERAGSTCLRLGPVTFKPRFNPYATSAEALAASFDRSRQYDSRLHSLFGAGWTLSAWARLSVLGVSGVCFYEDAGPLGWIRDEHDRDNPLYMTFALFSGTLAELGSPAEVLGMTGYDPLVLTVFRVHGPNGRLLMAVNHTNDLQTVRLNLGAKLAAAWVADEETMSGKRAAEAETGGGDGLIPHPDGSYALHLKPLSIVCLRIHDR